MKTMNFTASPGLYAIVGDRGDMCDQISARLSQLEAMLALTYGDQRETFGNNPDVMQDQFMWACGMMAGEIRQLFETMPERGEK